jgi:hypothetical protein
MDVTFPGESAEYRAARDDLTPEGRPDWDEQLTYE